MHAITISAKEAVNLKKPEVRVYGRFWREERKERNDILAL